MRCHGHVTSNSGLDHARHAERETGGADRRAGVLLAEDSVEQLGRAVDHPWLAFEAGRRVDVAGQSDEALDAVQLAKLGLQRREHVERAQPSRVVARRLGQLVADPALEHRPAVGVQRAVAGDEHEVAGAHDGGVVGRWRDTRWELDPELGESFGEPIPRRDRDQLANPTASRVRVHVSTML